MDVPLGRMAGNSLEVMEAIETLRGHGPHDLTELCVSLAVEALAAQGEDEQQAEARARATLQDGSALAKFRAFIEGQGGDPTYVDDPQKFDVAPGREDILAISSGFVGSIDALSVGRAVLVRAAGASAKARRSITAWA